MTFELIETKTLGTAASSIEFTSIPQDGTDLVALYSMRTDIANNYGYLYLTFNGVATGYSYRILYGDGSTAASVSQPSATRFEGNLTNGNSSTSNTFSNGQVYLPNYTSSSNKSVSFDSIAENNASSGNGLYLTAGLVTITNAITSMAFLPPSGNFVTGSTVSLYKVTKGSDGIVTTS